MAGFKDATELAQKCEDAMPNGARIQQGLESARMHYAGNARKDG